MSIRRFIHCSALVTLVCLGAACEPNHKQTDEAQRHAREANFRLERMNDIELKLRAEGISIRYPIYAQTGVSAKAHDYSFKTIKSLLGEYAGHGQTALRISEREDITFGDRAGLEERIATTQQLLAQINEREKQGTASVAPDSQRAMSPVAVERRFWSQWTSCRMSHNEDLVLHGVSIPTYSRETDGPALSRANKEQRQDILTRAKRFNLCENVLRIAEARLYGKPASTIKVFANERIETLIENLKEFEGSQKP